MPGATVNVSVSVPVSSRSKAPRSPVKPNVSLSVPSLSTALAIVMVAGSRFWTSQRTMSPLPISKVWPFCWSENVTRSFPSGPEAIRSTSMVSEIEPSGAGVDSRRSTEQAPCWAGRVQPAKSPVRLSVNVNVEAHGSGSATVPGTHWKSSSVEMGNICYQP
ncbi:MAG: hypothetical protein RLN74_05255, partial [Ilumatobacter fluminis]